MAAAAGLAGGVEQAGGSRRSRRGTAAVAALRGDGPGAPGTLSTTWGARGGGGGIPWSSSTAAAVEA